jgi:hypothetical protein
MGIIPCRFPFFNIFKGFPSPTEISNSRKTANQLPKRSFFSRPNSFVPYKGKKTNIAVNPNAM